MFGPGNIAQAHTADEWLDPQLDHRRHRHRFSRPTMSEDSKASFYAKAVGWRLPPLRRRRPFAAHIFAKDMPKDEHGGSPPCYNCSTSSPSQHRPQAVFAVKAAQRKTEADDFRIAREQWALTLVVLAVTVLVFITAWVKGDALVAALNLLWCVGAHA